MCQQTIILYFCLFESARQYLVKVILGLICNGVFYSVGKGRRRFSNLFSQSVCLKDFGLEAFSFFFLAIMKWNYLIYGLQIMFELQQLAIFTSTFHLLPVCQQFRIFLIIILLFCSLEQFLPLNCLPLTWTKLDKNQLVKFFQRIFLAEIISQITLAWYSVVVAQQLLPDTQLILKIK